MIGRVAENQAEITASTSQAAQGTIDIAAHDLCPVCQAGMSGILADEGRGGLIHQHRPLCPTGQGFQPQAAGAGKNIQHPAVFHHPAQDIEQGFLHPVSRGSGVLPFGSLESCSPGTARDNPHFPLQSGGTRKVFHRQSSCTGNILSYFFVFVNTSIMYNRIKAFLMFFTRVTRPISTLKERHLAYK